MSRPSSIGSGNGSEDWRRTTRTWHASAGGAPDEPVGIKEDVMSWGRFDTRTIVLIPIAIAINIVLGQTVSAVLKVPIYLDSVGTILVGALAGPLPGLATGVVAHAAWAYGVPPPFD